MVKSVESTNEIKTVYNLSVADDESYVADGFIVHNCTLWSILQSVREVKAEGIGWELFKNYHIAVDKFNPHYFLYENNKSAADEIKEQIASLLRVDDGTPFSPTTLNRFTYIDSALVSAQRRERFYVTGGMGDIAMPNPRNILLADIIGDDFNPTASAATPFVVGKLRELENIYGYIPKMFNAYNPRRFVDKAPTLTTGSTATSSCSVVMFAKVAKESKVSFRIESGYATIKCERYRVRLEDGVYILRGLSLAEYRRLQTIPSWVKMPCSESQSRKMLGNGWTIEVIKHLLSHIPEIKNKEDVEFEVLSMYDGMSCLQIALKELGCKVSRYVSYEIDKYAIQTTQENFPNTEQRGDAFAVRKDDWSY